MKYTSKIKKRKTVEKYLDLARGLNKLYNMKVTVKAIGTDELGTVVKGPETVKIRDQRKNRGYSERIPFKIS